MFDVNKFFIMSWLRSSFDFSQICAIFPNLVSVKLPNYKLALMHSSIFKPFGLFKQCFASQIPKTFQEQTLYNVYSFLVTTEKLSV